MRVLVDTNLMARIANGYADPLFPIAKQAISLLSTDGHTITLVPQIIYEFWAVATRPLTANGPGMSKEEARRSLESLAVFPLLRDERGIFQQWSDLIDKYDISGKTTHDARLVAAMLRHGITHLLTFNDMHFARFSEIEVWTPQSVVARGAT